jgi:5-methyltetrahydrofolate--homocysteine methyltransferase
MILKTNFEPSVTDNIVHAVTDNIVQAMKVGNINLVAASVKRALSKGVSPQTVLDDGLLCGMEEVGRLFEDGDYLVPDVLLSSMAFNQGMCIVCSSMSPRIVRAGGSVVIATVEGDLHDLGKNLVRLQMEIIGLKVIDLGVDVPVSKIVRAVRDERPDVLALSSMLTTTMNQQRKVIDALQDAGLRRDLLIAVGGAPISDDFREKIGADLYAADSDRAAQELRRRIAR